MFELTAIPVALSVGVDEVSVGTVLSYVTVRSVPAAVRAAFPCVSLIEKEPDGAIVTSPEDVAVTVMVQRVLLHDVEEYVPLVIVKSAAVIVLESRDSLEVIVNLIELLLVGSLCRVVVVPLTVLEHPCSNVIEGGVVSTFVRKPENRVALPTP